MLARSHVPETRGHHIEVGQAETLAATAELDDSGGANGKAAAAAEPDETIDLTVPRDAKSSVEIVPGSVETTPLTLEAEAASFVVRGESSSGASRGSSDPTIDLPTPGMAEFDDETTLGATGAEDGPGPLRIQRLGAPLPESGDARYTVTRLHAKGGHGQVWRALDSVAGPRGRVEGTATRGSARMTRSGRGLSRKRGSRGSSSIPGIVPIYELGMRPSDGQPFYTMRFIRGRTLREAAHRYHEKRSKRAESTHWNSGGCWTRS